MKISVFGLGYVGTVAAACLARDGHDVIGVDPNLTKVGHINKGQSPIIENDIGELIAKGAASGKLRATAEALEAVRKSEISLVCVGTPSLPNGSLDTKYVSRVCKDIGSAIAKVDSRHTVVIRSTLLPGSMQQVVIPTLEAASGLKSGVDFGLCNNPEFLREGTAVYDYDNPPKTVIGEFDSDSGDALLSLYSHIDAPVIRTTVDAAEMVKYVDNVWHALKICFANEIGNISKTLGLDGRHIMEMFCQDKKLNISTAYLKPGFAFGGSCLPKDVRALTYHARSLDTATPLLDSVLPSNQNQISVALDVIRAKDCRKIGVLGFSFKEGTDDLRESPVVELIETLIGKGYELEIYDRNVQIAALVGANKDFILHRIPHITKLMTDSIQHILDFAELVVIGNNDPEFLTVLKSSPETTQIIDLAGIGKALGSTHENYEGLCW